MTGTLTTLTRTDTEPLVINTPGVKVKVIRNTKGFNYEASVTSDATDDDMEEVMLRLQRLTRKLDAMYPNG